MLTPTKYKRKRRVQSKNMLDSKNHLFGSDNEKSGNPVLEYGNCNAEIHGNKYDNCQKLLKSIYNLNPNNKILFTLTPICSYQLDQGWPEPPFVNINTYGSISTEKENWLGYIPIDFSEIDFEQLVNDNGNIDVYGKIKKSSEGYDITLNVSEKYKTLEINVGHNDRQVAYLTNLAQRIPDYYIVVDIRKSDNGKNYDLIFHKQVVATTSSKKIDDWLNGDEYVPYVKMRIQHFRYDYSNQHYSKITLVRIIKL